MNKMQVVVVGGFLGAGKTTLLAQAAKHLAEQGRRAAIITNDQAADLVDTNLLRGSGVAVEEVSGGCFCCRFEDLERSANRLIADKRPDVLLSEPVGSCMDISATVLQPMKQQWGEWAAISPFSVLVDPFRLRHVFDAGQSKFPDSIRYIIKKQLEEADYLVINKTDLISPEELAVLKRDIAFAGCDAEILEMSALRDCGVVEWLGTVLSVSNGGNKILDVEYDIYARGEAELGWLNASITLTARKQTDWNAFARDVIEKIQLELAGRSSEIGHLKLVMSHPAGQISANVTSIGDKPVAQGDIPASAGVATLIINARALIDPQQLKSIVERSITSAAGGATDLSELRLNSLRPAYPRPTHRIDRVVSQA